MENHLLKCIDKFHNRGKIYLHTTIEKISLSRSLIYRTIKNGIFIYFLQRPCTRSLQKNLCTVSFLKIILCRTIVIYQWHRVNTLIALSLLLYCYYDLKQDVTLSSRKWGLILCNAWVLIHTIHTYFTYRDIFSVISQGDINIRRSVKQND